MTAEDVLDRVKKKRDDCSASIPGYSGTWDVLDQLVKEIERAMERESLRAA